jgi:hypothetical protein
MGEGDCERVELGEEEGWGWGGGGGGGEGGEGWGDGVGDSVDEGRRVWLMRR